MEELKKLADIVVVEKAEYNELIECRARVDALMTLIQVRNSMRLEEICRILDRPGMAEFVVERDRKEQERIRALLNRERGASTDEN